MNEVTKLFNRREEEELSEYKSEIRFSAHNYNSQNDSPSINTKKMEANMNFKFEKLSQKYSNFLLVNLKLIKDNLNICFKG